MLRHMPHQKIKGAIAKNRFTVDRGLEEYGDLLGPSFLRAIQKLKKGQHWIDSGSGETRALIEFAESSKNPPRLTGITFKVTKSSKAAGIPRVHLIKGKYFESLSTKQIPAADLITDVLGIINYTYDLSKTLEKILRLLKRNGTLLVYLPYWTTIIEDQNGKRLFLVDWLRSIPGLEIRILNRRGKKDKDFSFVIRKKVNKVRFPKLILIESVHHNSVARVFRVNSGV